jgi:hypothetical protein
MKSVFNEIDKEKSKEIEFPVLAEYISGDSFVILFLSMKCGVCVSSNNLDWSVGDYDNALIDVTDKKYWCILSPEESIVLSND